MIRFPENLVSLWDEEDRTLGASKAEVLSSQELMDHVHLIETYMDAVDTVRQKNKGTDREIAIVGLFMRTFDTLSHATRLSLSGDYQASAMMARDLLETCFLIDYLLAEDGRPEAWLKSDADTVKKNYSPVKIRMALDVRDGFSEKKREATYKMLSNYGAHPTPQSFLLKRGRDQRLKCGPSLNTGGLRAMLQELARVVLPLSGNLLLFIHSDIDDGAHFSSKLALTLQKYKECYLSNPPATPA